MLLGYIRVSTAEQNEARQVEALRQRGVAPENFYIDKASGKNTDRAAFRELRACLKSFDKNGGVGDNRKKQAGAGENASIPK